MAEWKEPDDRREEKPPREEYVPLWCIRESSPRMWTFHVAKFAFLPWHMARRMPPTHL
jgi:hypothetical protein